MRYRASLATPAVVACVALATAVAIPALASHDGEVAQACPPERVPDDGFRDVPDDNAHEPAIDCTVWWKVATGTGIASP